MLSLKSFKFNSIFQKFLKGLSTALQFLKTEAFGTRILCACLLLCDLHRELTGASFSFILINKLAGSPAALSPEDNWPDAGVGPDGLKEFIRDPCTEHKKNVYVKPLTIIKWTRKMEPQNHKLKQAQKLEFSLITPQKRERKNNQCFNFWHHTGDTCAAQRWLLSA